MSYPEAKRLEWKPSRYNWLLPIDDLGGGGVVYNAFTGACLDFDASDFRLVDQLVSRPAGTADLRQLGDQAVDIGSVLIAGGFLIDVDFDERSDLQSRSGDRSSGLPLIMTINPTFACNLSCSYCFVGKKTGIMSRDVEARLIAFVEEQLRPNDVPSFNVDWFGGEPLLATGSMERLSQAFIKMCGAKNIPYKAQVITNGTLLDAEKANLLLTCGVDRIQITLDGGSATHDERRPWKKNAGKHATLSCFDETIRGIENVIGKFIVRLRMNVDARNIDESMEMLTAFDRRGWLSSDSRFYPYPSMVSNFTEAAADGWSEEHECERDVYFGMVKTWLSFLNERGVPIVGERLYGFPEPTTLSCGAVSSRGWVVNYDGELHRCGLDSDISSRAVGNIATPIDRANAQSQYWDSYDPFASEICGDCKALPVCMSGCARDRRDGRTKYLSANCDMHLKREPELIRQHARLRRINLAGQDGDAGVLAAAQAV